MATVNVKTLGLRTVCGARSYTHHQVKEIEVRDLKINPKNASTWTVSVSDKSILKELYGSFNNAKITKVDIKTNRFIVSKTQITR